jgi:hypothetical protein
LQAPAYPAVGDSAASLAVAAAANEREATGSHSAKKVAAATASPAAATAAGPSILVKPDSAAVHSATPAAMLAHKTGAARPGGSSRGTAAALQSKAAKARLQRVQARLERRAASKDSDVDMFKESCVIC